MKKIYEIIKSNPLFEEINYHDFEAMLDCVAARTQRYNKDEVILMTGDPVSFIGVILSGSVTVTKEDADGNAVILAAFTEPELFGEVFACAGIEYSPVTVRAMEDTEILLINYRKIIGDTACPFHLNLIENMLRLITRKNLLLNQKIDVLSKRSVREKIMAFFDAHRRGINKFTIPYNREEMARYLCVDRSALSKELCRMRDEGLIDFNRNEFEIL